MSKKENKSQINQLTDLYNVRDEWKNFSKWKKSFPTCVAYFSGGKLFHIGEPKKGETR